MVIVSNDTDLLSMSPWCEHQFEPRFAARWTQCEGTHADATVDRDLPNSPYSYLYEA